MVIQKLNSIFTYPATPNVPANGLLSAKRLAAFIMSFLQFSALLFVMRQYGLEKSSGIGNVTPLILGGFAVAAFTSLKYRPMVLFSLSLCIIYYAFGLFSGSLMVLTSFAIIGCCHLPVKLWLRVLLIIIIAAGMAVLRADLFYAPRASLVVPYIASMFMFRVIIYLYEMKYSQLSSTLFQKLSYFFLFPNQCFLLFPIIDYKTYIKSYYDRPEAGIWQKGIRWMLRGICHMIAYRLIYYYLLISPSDVRDLTGLLQYITCNYAVILRLSGLFHFITGLLCMFGLNLPPTFNNYLLATSFVSLWRRINTYWREFMMKIFFYPIMFRYKKFIAAKNLLPATLLTVFVITWAMHNYQWFWIRGSFILTPMDIIFWATLGSCITINSVWLERSLSRAGKELRIAIAYPLAILKMISIFLFMSVMWSLWNSSSIDEWIFLISKSAVFTGMSLVAILATFIGIIFGGSLLLYVFSFDAIRRLIDAAPAHTLYLTLPSIAVLLCLACKPFQQRIPMGIRPFVASLTNDRLNKTDKERSENGYYKKLIDGDNTSGGLWEINIKRPKTFTTIDDITVRTGGLLTKTFRPNVSLQVNGCTVQTNAFGLRDRPYKLLPPKNHFRIALLGGSYEMGSGVNNNEVYEQLTEDSLNKTNADPAIDTFEIMNFAMGGYHLLQQVELCHTSIYKYQPNAVMYTAHTNERLRFLGFLTTSIRSGTNLKYPFINEVKAVSGVKQSMSKAEIQERLEPFMDAMILWCYSEIAATARKHNAMPIWVFLPATADTPDDLEYETLKGYAIKLGFVILDLRGVYNNEDRTKIRISEWDTHPNAKGQHIIANKFYTEFKRHEFEITKYKP